MPSSRKGNAVLRQIEALRKMSRRELELKWRDLHGVFPPKSGRRLLMRLLAFRVQELFHGGLCGESKGMLEELAARGGNPTDDGALALRLATARAWLEALKSGEAPGVAELAASLGLDRRRVLRTLRLSCLSPAIQRAALEGRIASGPGVERLLRAIPDDWRRQTRLLKSAGGLKAPPRPWTRRPQGIRGVKSALGPRRIE